MDYTVKGADGTFSCSVSKKAGPASYVIDIGGKEHSLEVVSMGPRGIEFMLDNKYHWAKYEKATTAQMDLVVDGAPITLNMHAHLDDIVYKNSGGAGPAGSDDVLTSQMPGKVISVAAQEGSKVELDDPVCVLESMKMQVSLKAHKAGTIKSVMVKDGDTIAKGDPVAEIE